jgi:S-DNA-T family DNA segregation ATPase FtsK/SpoIIIE
MAGKSSGKSRVRDEIIGVALLALGVLAFLALVRNSPDDPPAGTAATVTNLIGPFGAYLSFGMVWLLGIFLSYGIPLALVAWGVVMMRGGDLKKAGMRTGYLLVCVVLVCTLLSIMFDQTALGVLLPGITIHKLESLHTLRTSGGNVGLVAAALLTHYFKTVGAYIVTITLLVVLAVVTAIIQMKAIIDTLHTWLAAIAVFLRERVGEAWRAYQKRRKLKKEIARRTQKPVVRGGAEPDETATADTAVGPEPELEPELKEPVVNVPETEAQAAGKPAKEKKEKRSSDATAYQFPTLELLDEPQSTEGKETKDELLANADLLKNALAEFGVDVNVEAVNPGPVITQYEVSPMPGIKISRIVSLTDDLALKMKARGVRIVAPIPGKGTVGIELPNRNPETVYMRDVATSEVFQKSKSLLTLGLGKSVSGEIVCERLDKMPHLLVAGATGSGKSVCINTIIASLVYRATPWELRFIMIDPKRVELSMYQNIPHLLFPVVTEPRDAPAVLDWMIDEMEERYKKLQRLLVRDLDGYNAKIKGMSAKQKEEFFGEEADKFQFLPYIVLIVDEFADVMLATESKVEEPITRLAQKSRAVGIHLILTTQRPSVDVITGVIKANFPSRIAFKVAQRNDSRTILDANGAEALLGRGDMLYISAAHPKAIRYHGAFISDVEAERIANHLRKQPKPDYEPEKTLEDFKQEAELAEAGGGGAGSGVGRDPLFNEAARLVITHQQGSVSLVQRRLALGYTRAARIIDQLADAGVVGPFDGSKARQVLLDESHLDDFPAAGKKPDGPA